MSAAFDRALAQMDTAAERLVQQQVESIALHYVRSRDLPKLGIDPEGIGEADILPKLRTALIAERNRIKSGHWSYTGPSRVLSIRGAILAEEGQRDRRLGEAYATTAERVVNAIMGKA